MIRLLAVAVFLTLACAPAVANSNTYSGAMILSTDGSPACTDSVALTLVETGPRIFEHGFGRTTFEVEAERPDCAHPLLQLDGTYHCQDVRTVGFLAEPGAEDGPEMSFGECSATIHVSPGRSVDNQFSLLTNTDASGRIAWTSEVHDGSQTTHYTGRGVLTGLASG